MKQQEIFAFNTKTKSMRDSVSLASCLVMLVGSLAASGVQAQASVSNLSVKSYGQLNYGLLFGDTGDGSEHFIVDNDNSASRVGARVRGDLDGTNLIIGAHAELEYQQNPSNSVSLSQRSISGEFNERHLNVFVSGDFGQLSLGQSDGAANGNIERDLSGTLVVSWTNPALVGGGLEFLDEQTSTRVRLISAMSDQDFESRYSRLRYDLPSMGDVQLSISQGIKGQDDVSELGARFSGDLGGKVIGAIGFSSREVGGQADRFQTLGGSVSWLHKSGINVTGAYSTTSDDDPANPDADFYFGKLGYKSGKHAFDVHYAVTDDRVQKGDSADTLGIGYVYKPTNWFDAYAGLNRHSLDRPGADFEDIDTVLIGSRLKF